MSPPPHSLSASRRAMLCAAVIAGAGVIACAAPPAPTAPRRSPLQQMADSTFHLVHYAAIAFDTAALDAGLGAVTSSLPQVQIFVSSARAAAQVGLDRLTAARAQGDRIGGVFTPVIGDAELGEGPRQYARYWQLGRAKLEIARGESALALSAADSAMACPTTPCAVSSVRSVQLHSTAAAGAAHESVSLVRFATAFVH